MAARFSGEVIGADAFQIYRGLDLLTAKPEANLRARAPHHLIGEVPLSEECDAARYAELARARIAEVQGRGRLPVIVGGTGFYVRALTHGLPDLPGADLELRRELENTPRPDLLARLRKLDPVCAEKIDQANPRRVIRALEVCLLTGRPFSEFQPDTAMPCFPLRGVTLTCDRAELARRIDARTEMMWTNGVVEEVRGAIRNETPVSRTAANAIGFHEIERHLAGEMTASECIAAIQAATRKYAKRQMTWFRKETAFPSIERATALETILAQIERGA